MPGMDVSETGGTKQGLIPVTYGQEEKINGLKTGVPTATSSGEFWGRVDIVDIRVDIRISKNPDV